MSPRSGRCRHANGTRPKHNSPSSSANVGKPHKLDVQPARHTNFLTVPISQVFGGGGNSGATYTTDFIELFNDGSAIETLTGWSVQYNSATGSGPFQVTTLTGTIQPYHYYLVSEATGAGGTVSLPSAEAAGSIAMSSVSGKVALVAGTAACPSTGCTSGLIDLVGYGAADFFEGAAAAPSPLTNALADLRLLGGCQDTNQNGSDFTTGTANPRNGSSAANDCSALGSAAVPEPSTWLLMVLGFGWVASLSARRRRVAAVPAN